MKAMLCLSVCVLMVEHGWSASRPTAIVPAPELCEYGTWEQGKPGRKSPSPKRPNLLRPRAPRKGSIRSGPLPCRYELVITMFCQTRLTLMPHHLQ